MPIARFSPQPGFECSMVVREDQIGALAPQAAGIRIPVEISPVSAGAGQVAWDISYLYTELWSAPEQGQRLIAVALAEFTTDTHRPTSVRIPLGGGEVALLEELRRQGDLRLVLHLQATLIGAIPRDQVPDEGRRRTLEAMGIDQEVFGPIRRSDDVLIQIGKWQWQEEILPQWRDTQVRPPVIQVQASPGSVASNPAFDIQALARSLRGASPDADIEEILKQCQAPIVGL